MCQTPLRQRRECRTVLVPTELPGVEAAHIIGAPRGKPKAAGGHQGGQGGPGKVTFDMANDKGRVILESVHIKG